MTKKMTKSKRKICFIITSFIHYSRSFLILDELKKRSDVDLHIVIGGTALLAKYSAKAAYIKEILENKGFKQLREIHFNLEGDSLATKAKTAGLGVIEFSSVFNDLKPDLVVLRGDRFEVLSAAVAASFMSIPVAHLEGGDVSGTLDESVRHAITKLANFHFATNKEAERRLIRMGEDPKTVFNFGSPDIEVVEKISKQSNVTDFIKTGSGFPINPLKDKYLVVMYHPVHSEYQKAVSQTKSILSAIYKSDLPTFWFWPNFDAGAEMVSKTIRVFSEQFKDHKFHFMRYLPPADFIWLLSRADCLVGNSSAGIKECSYLGIPVVNIGSRQDGRLRGQNVVDVGDSEAEITNSVRDQVVHGRYKTSTIYRGAKTAKRIAEVLAAVKLYSQKNFHNA